MPTTRRSRTLAAAPAALWVAVADPHHHPRWLPGVRRVEAVAGGRFTHVLVSPRGRTVRVDHRVTTSEPPRVFAWEQELSGTPFERFLRAAHTTITLEDADGGTRVTLAVTERTRGTARLGGPLVGRATRRRLDAALDALDAL